MMRRTLGLLAVALCVALSSPWREVGAQDLKGEIRYALYHPSSVNAVAFSPASKILATSGQDSKVRLWSTRFAQVAEFEYRRFVILKSVTFSPDGKTLAVAAMDGKTRLWDVATRKERATFELRSNTIAFHPGG